MITYSPIIQTLFSDLFDQKKVSVEVLRLDLIHPEISGNKWFKLKYNIEEARKQGHHTILTFGGAFSNHIYATAAACKLAGLNCIGVIRGEDIATSNPTLSEVKKMGMQLHFVSRGDYKLKETPGFIDALKAKFGKFYLIPEGGNNALGIKGCGEIVTFDMDHPIIICAVGSGATFKGVRAHLKHSQQLIGIRVLKQETEEKNILNEYHFGGYAKCTDELLKFKKDFEKQFNIPLDYVYTLKVFYAATDLIQKNKIAEHSKVLIIHTGGLQGNKGYKLGF